MSHKLPCSLLAALSLMVAGCAKQTIQPAAANMVVKFQPATFGSGPQRFIAERDTLNVVIQASELQKAWELTIAFCATIQCEVISSSLTMQTNESSPSGNVSVRVAPGDLQALVNRLQDIGKIIQHNTERQDETASVVDTDAKIKNLNAFRDNLRAMLSKPNLTVDNIVEINKQLTDTQADLDSETAQRKILANETEKVAVDISFNVGTSGPPAGVLANIWNALLDAGATLLGSVETLLTVVIFLIPWAILLFLIVWLTIKARRRSRRRPIPATAPTVRA